MATITYRKDTSSWSVSFYLGTVRHRRAFKTEAEAQAFKTELEGRGSFISKGEVTTLREAYNGVLEATWSNIKDGEGTASRARGVLDWFGWEKPVELITGQELQKFKQAMLRKDNSGGTINRKLSVLSQMLRWAFDNEKLSKVPPIKREPESKGRERSFSAKEVQDIVKFFRDNGEQETAEFFTVQVLTGLRLSKQFNITSDNIRSGSLYFEGERGLGATKNRKAYAVPLVGEAKAILERRALLYPTGRVWDLTQSQYRLRFDRMKASFGFGSDVVRHTTRHTCATLLLSMGVDPYVVKEVLNHSSIAVTQKYLHMNQSQVAEKMSVLGNLITV
jgi:integrase